VARVVRDKFAGDSISEVRRQWEGYLEAARAIG
jgi:hypothetical protein